MHFFFCYAILTWIWTYKTHVPARLIINLSLAVFNRQSLPWELPWKFPWKFPWKVPPNKPQGDPDSSSSVLGFLKNHDFCTCKSLANPCKSPFANPCKSLRKLAKPRIAKACESLQNTAKPYLRICTKLVKAWEIKFAQICESLLNWSISAKAYLRKHICESLQKYMHFALANPCENTICETLRKVYLLTAPPLLLARRRTCLLSLVLLNVFTLFAVATLKPIVSAYFHSFVCPNPDMPTNLRRNFTQLFQERKKRQDRV